MMEAMDYFQRIIDEFDGVRTLVNGQKKVFEDAARSSKSYLFAKAALGMPIDDTAFEPILERIYYRRDCTDFDVNVLIRMIRLYGDKGVISEAMMTELKAVILDYDYWFHKNNKRAGNQIFWTENHVFQYLTAEYLATALYPDDLFRMREAKGSQTQAMLREKLLKFIVLKGKVGYSEWHSNVYADENFHALLNLYDFTGDAELKAKAKDLMDVMFLQMAVSSHKGHYGATHGRAYDRNVTSPLNDNTGAIQLLAWGLGETTNCIGAVSGLAFATSTYEIPEMITRIVEDKNLVIETKEQQSFDVEDGPSLGFGYEDEDDLVNYWHNMAYSHRLILKNNIEMEKKYHLWLNEWTYFEYRHMQRCEKEGKEVPKCRCSNYMGRINSYTYKTPDYLLSCAQNFRKGEAGYQQHIWQATLDDMAIVFTNHPGIGPRPGYWAGNGIMPKAIQHKNTVIAIYDIHEAKDYAYTHAYFPVKAFDEVRNIDGWIFGMKNHGYVAIHSQNDLVWDTETVSERQEILCHSPRNIWLCQLGSLGEYGSFDTFIEKVIHEKPVYIEMSVSYRNPDGILLEVGYDSPLMINGDEELVDGYKRMENKYCQSDYMSGVYQMSEGDEALAIDFTKENKNE